MSSYYFPAQPVILKQSSQILTPFQLHAHNYAPPLSERAQDKPLPIVLQPQHNSAMLSRDGSLKHLHDSARLGQPTIIQTRSVPAVDNPRTFSDYQINPGVRAEEQQLPVGGGYNISSKIGQKVKLKTDLHKSNSKATLHSNASELNKAPSIRYVESIIEADKGEIAKFQTVIEIINLEIAKINERVNSHEERFERLQKQNKKNEENAQNPFSSPQMEEISKILSLVEKSQQRDDYRKSMKMIEQLRSTILELNNEVKTLSSAGTTPPIQRNDEALEIFKKQFLESVTQKGNEAKQASEAEARELAKRISEIEEHWKHWKKEQEAVTSITSSLKKFEGRMVTLLHEERLTPTHSPPTALTVGVGKHATLSEKDANSPVVVSTKTYYIDSSGYLLDKNKYYLLNHRNEQIRLTERELELLKKHNIL